MTIDLAQLPYADDVPAPVRHALSSAALVFEPVAVERAVDQLAVRLTVAWQDRNPLLVCVLPHGIVLTGMLLRRLIFPLQVCYVAGQDTNIIRFDAHPTHFDARPLLFLHGRGSSLTARMWSQWGAAGGAKDVQHIALVGPVCDENEFADGALACDASELAGCGLDYLGYGANLPGIYAVQGSQDTAP